MEDWSPLVVFTATYFAAALGGIGALLRSKEPIGFRNVSEAIIYSGLAGTSLGLVGYEFLGGRKYPSIIIGCGALVGLQIIKIKDIKDILKRIIG